LIDKLTVLADNFSKNTKQHYSYIFFPAKTLENSQKVDLISIFRQSQ